MVKASVFLLWGTIDVPRIDAHSVRASRGLVLEEEDFMHVLHTYIH